LSKSILATVFESRPFVSACSLEAAASNNLNAEAIFSQAHISGWPLDVEPDGNGAASRNDFSR
jgi:hypothetical protein